MAGTPKPSAVPSTEDAERGAKRCETDRAARRRDPHGTRPADAAAEDEPKGRPNSDRHRSETASGQDGSA